MPVQENPDIVSLKINGRIFSRWTGMEIARSQTALAAAFSVSCPWFLPDAGEKLLARPGDAVSILIGADEVIGGAIDSIAADAKPEGVSFTISGRSRAGDLVDCSAVIPGGQLRNLTLLAACRRLCQPFGIGVSMVPGTDPGKAIPLIEIEQSETVVGVIQRLCRDAQMLCWSDADGDLLIGRGAQGKTTSGIVHRVGIKGRPVIGNTILSISGSFDASQRFSHVLVRGQEQGVIGKDALSAASPQGAATDGDIKRYRPKIVSAENAGTKAAMKARAEWEVARRIAEGTKITATMPGWRQSPGGPLWDVGLMAAVTADALNLNEELLITGVTFRQDANAQRADLTIEPPAAQEPVDKSGGAGGHWGSIRAQTHAPEGEKK